MYAIVLSNFAPGTKLHRLQKLNVDAVNVAQRCINGATNRVVNGAYHFFIHHVLFRAEAKNGE
jgi:hypothetical protein